MNKEHIYIQLNKNDVKFLFDLICRFAEGDLTNYIVHAASYKHNSSISKNNPLKSPGIDPPVTREGNQGTNQFINKLARMCGNYFSNKLICDWSVVEPNEDGGVEGFIFIVVEKENIL